MFHYQKAPFKIKKEGKLTSIKNLVNTNLSLTIPAPGTYNEGN